MYFIDGQALTPSSFGETSATTGAWDPIAYAGTYGTNGFYLPFSDNSAATAATIGADSSGNGNNWTPSGISVTAGVTNDSLTDTPTNYGTDTGAGGEVRGNYCTINAISQYTTPSLLSGGNLTLSGSNPSHRTNWLPSTGKFYFEVDCTTVGSGGYLVGGAQSLYRVDGSRWTGAAWVAYGASYTSGDRIGCEIDLTNNTVEWFKNQTSQGLITSAGLARNGVDDWTGGDLTGTWTAHWNFGQRPYARTANSGFKALCTQNLPDPAIKKASQYFDAKLRSGTGAAYSVTGIGFQPDLVWIKARDAAYSHNIADTVNGAGYAQFSDQAIAQVSNHDITAFNSDGYSANQTVNYELSNGTPRNYIDWMWRGGGNANTFNLNGTGYASMAAAGLTDGSQAATGISVNTTCGMSVVNFSAAASGTGTIGHGLGVAPRLIIAKAKSSAYQWYIQHASQGPTKYGLFSTAAFAAATAVWNDTAPTSTVFSHGTGWNGYGTTVAYCFAEIAGFSKFGSYTGNGSANGPFVWCGFRPRWIMVKRTNTASSWFQIDTARDTYNRAQNYLKVDVADAEGVFGLVDLVSNGFKWREDGSASGMNVSASTYIFAAFAEHPFRTARAR